MNKRIKKKFIKRTIQKYENKETLTPKERKLINVYVELKEFDYASLWNGIKNVLVSIANNIVKAFKRFAKQLTDFSAAVDKLPEFKNNLIVSGRKGKKYEVF